MAFMGDLLTLPSGEFGGLPVSDERSARPSPLAFGRNDWVGQLMGRSGRWRAVPASGSGGLDAVEPWERIEVSESE